MDKTKTPRTLLLQEKHQSKDKEKCPISTMHKEGQLAKAMYASMGQSSPRDAIIVKPLLILMIPKHSQYVD